MSAIRLSIFATLVAISCADDDGLPSSWTLENDGLRVTVHKRPYALTIADPSGRTILESLGAGAGDGYAGVAWTSGAIEMKSYISPGYTRTTTALDPWRDGLHVVAATADATTLTVTLAGDGGERVTVTHRLRPSTLRVEASLDGAAAPRAWAAAFRSPLGEGFLGLGERFTRTNFRGLSMYSWLEEGGIGQNEGTPPGAMNPFPNGEPMSYYPVPFFLSTRGYAFWFDTTYYNVVDLAVPARGDAWRAWSAAPTLAYEIYVPIPGDPRPWPYQLIDLFTATTGRPMVPPAWTYGPRRRINHGDRQGDVSELQAMRDLDLAITAFDDAFHFLPKGTTAEQRAGLVARIAEARALGYRVNGYFNSFFSENPEDAIAPKTQEGLAAGHFLHGKDGAAAKSWILTGSNIVNLYILDFTSEAATRWYTDLFQWALDLGYSGWMYDFGEYVPADAVGASGLSGEALHNLYPVLYQKAAHDRLEQSPVAGDWLTFVRSGYTGASRWSPMVWGGDPAASFESSDGLPSMVRGGINMGVSGVPNWGGDIGGYHCLIDGAEKADGELLARWIQHGALTPNMQDQDACLGAESRDKANIFDSPDAQAAWRSYARLHTRLQPYFMALAEDAHATGAPIIRHVFLENPDHPEWAGVDDAYYLGPSLFVAPVVVRGAREKRVALPAGKWLDWDTRRVIAGGGEVTLDAPLARLPLLVRDGGIVPLLDPRIDTLAEEEHPDVVGPGDVADVLDVVVFLSRGAARATLAGGATLEATLDGAPAAPALPVVDEPALATCDGCARLDVVDGGVTRVRVSGGGAAVAAGGLTLRATGVTRRVRWDVLVAP